ncbi:MAG: bifunctional demethylmenaquinone methyltransferase/2-methoxy-6-polyprenyl-1,4-benzoquinol methylase UbiE [Gammaproteobacteria bacterium]
MDKNSQKTADFGYQQVPWSEKVAQVDQVFSSVAGKYDLMNDLMSFTLHRLWKSFTIGLSHIRPGQHVLDLAGGSGDLTQKIANKVTETGHVYLADLNAAMLTAGRDRLINVGLINNISYIQTNGEALPFADNVFDCVTIAFGLRNITDKSAALRAMCRVLKPGGKVLILEFSQAAYPWLQSIYDAYSFYVIPRLGKLITGDPQSYQYLVESIRMHPNQQALKEMIEKAGFEDCNYHNLNGGIVALHQAYKY